MTHPTLIPEQNLLTEQLQASLNYERVKILRQNLQRADRYLRAAMEASERFVNRIEMVRDYDEADERAFPWTLIHTKQELLSMAIKNRNRYKAFMEWQQKIVLKNL